MNTFWYHEIYYFMIEWCDLKIKQLFWHSQNIAKQMTLLWYQNTVPCDNFLTCYFSQFSFIICLGSCKGWLTFNLPVTHLDKLPCTPQQQIPNVLSLAWRSCTSWPLFSVNISQTFPMWPTNNMGDVSLWWIQNIDGLVQDCCNSSALAMEPCSNPSISTVGCHVLNCNSFTKNKFRVTASEQFE